MSLRELRIIVKRGSLFDQGYDWALEEHERGTPLDQIRHYPESTMDYNDFDRGADAAIQFLEKQLKDEFI